MSNLRSLSNRELIEDAFKSIENEGYHIEDKRYGNYYFLFDGEEDSICHFHIKEIPGFLFAFWNINRLDNFKEAVEKDYPLWTDAFGICSKTELIFFTQYEREIDKFKPSRSGFVTGIYRDSWKEEDDSGNIVDVEEWYMYDLVRILKYMRKHPIKAYVYSGMQVDKVYEEVSSLHCLKIYIRDWFWSKKYKFEKWFKLKMELNACKRLYNKVKDNYYVIVLLRPDNWSPRLDVRTRRKDVFDLKKCIKNEHAFEKFDDKWFNGISLEEYDLELKETYTKEELDDDIETKERFIKMVTFNYKDEDAFDIIYSNCENLVSDDVDMKEVD